MSMIATDIAPREAATRSPGQRLALGALALCLAVVVCLLVVVPLANVFNIALYVESDFGLSDQRSLEALI